METNEQNNALTLNTTTNSIMKVGDIENMMKMAESYIQSGLLPAHIKTPQAALVIMQYGHELSLGPIQALNNIYVVSGKPTLSGNLMSALLRAGGTKWQTLKDFEPVVNDQGQTVDYITTIKFIRDGIEEIVSYTWREAKIAQLTGKDNWQKYPRNMMYWRCFSLGARRIAADHCMGMYMASELADATHGAPVIVDTEDGEIQILETNKQ